MDKKEEQKDIYSYKPFREFFKNNEDKIITAKEIPKDKNNNGK